MTLFGFDRLDVPDRLPQPAIVQPVDPRQRSELHAFEGPPGSTVMNDLGFI